MIQGKLHRTDVAYFAKEKDSSSSIKCFLENRRKYQKKYVLGEQVDEVDEENKAVLIGNLVDCLMLVPEEFDNRFYKTTGEKPSGQMLEFVNHLYDVSVENTGEEGEAAR